MYYHHSPAACQHLLDLTQHWLQWCKGPPTTGNKVPIYNNGHAGLAHSANVAILLLLTKKGGLGLPSLVKKQQITCQTLLCPSQNSSVCHIKEELLQAESRNQRQKFRPAVRVNQVQAEHTELNRCTLTKAAKSAVVQAEEEELTLQLHSLGEMSRQFQGSAAGL